MTRDEITRRMYQSYRFAFALLGVGEDTVETEIADAVDDALRAFGTAEADVPTATVDTDVAGFLKLARFTVLGWLLAQLATLVDTKTEAGLDRRRSQTYAALSKEREALRSAAEAYDPAAGTGAAVVGKLTTDWVEPLRVY